MAQLNPVQTQIDVLGKITTALAEVEEAQRPQILKMVADLLGVPAGAPPDEQRAPPPPPSQRTTPPSAVTPESGVTPKQFIAQKQPETDVERVACLAYYLTHHRKIPRFKAKDIAEINTAAAQPKFTNIRAAVENATRSSK
jgi:hypothetical protein